VRACSGLGSADESLNLKMTADPARDENLEAMALKDRVARLADVAGRSQDIVPFENLAAVARSIGPVWPFVDSHLRRMHTSVEWRRSITLSLSPQSTAAAAAPLSR
jgi:hypothetical protein